MREDHLKNTLEEWVSQQSAKSRRSYYVVGKQIPNGQVAPDGMIYVSEDENGTRPQLVAGEYQNGLKVLVDKDSQGNLYALTLDPVWAAKTIGAGWRAFDFFANEISDIHLIEQQFNVGRLNRPTDNLIGAISAFHHPLGYFSGDVVDFTAYVPNSPGDVCLVLVSLNPTTNSLEATASATISDLVDNYTQVDVASLASTIAKNKMPLGAITLQYGQTKLSQSRIFNARQFLNVPHDPFAIHTNVSGEIDALPQRTTPASSDLLLVSVGGALRYVRWDQLPAGGGGASAFIDLTDTFNSYSGLESKVLRVKPDGSGIEAVDPDTAAGIPPAMRVIMNRSFT